MKKCLVIVAIFSISFSLCNPVFSYYDNSQYRPVYGGEMQSTRPTFETREQAYARRSAENYQQYQNNNYQMPLGGYNRPLNDQGGTQWGQRNPYQMR